MVVSESDLHDECMIERLALSSFRHRWRTLLAWIALVAAVIVGGSALAGDFANGGRMKGTDSDDGPLVSR
jgi:uncharacterized membrane protein YdfJ with MMPL/SSD domain